MDSFFNKVKRVSKRKLFYATHYLLTGERPKKLLFNHLPKCGGTSLGYFIQNHYAANRTFMIRNPLHESIKKFKSFSESEKNHYDLIIGHISHFLINDVSKDMIKTTVLREPIDRILSHYFYAKNEPSHYLNALINSENLSLADYVQHKDVHEVRNYYTNHFSKLELTDRFSSDEDAYKQAMINIEEYDVVGTLENFDIYTKSLQELVGFKSNYEKRDLYKTPIRKAVDEIDEKTLDIIKKHNQFDIEFYNHIKKVLTANK